MIRRPLLVVCGMAALLAGGWALADRLEDTFYIPLDHPAIHYDGQPNDRVAHLDQRLETGEVKLDYAPNGWGYLPALLKQLAVNVDSQVLVFSKTSIQTNHIAPKTPRAIYFNDDVSIGYVQGGDVLELTALDPKLGIILYTMDAEQTPKPEFARRNDCLRCHQGPTTLGIPGILVSSLHPQSEQFRDVHGASFMTDHRVPISERWGGWYVTGLHGKQTHLGNNVALVDPLHPGGPGGPDTQNVTSLKEWFDTSRYPAPTSDIVALLTLEHQTRMTNLLIRIGWDARIALHDGKNSDEDRKQLNSEIDEMVAYMTFAGEDPLHSPITGGSTFTETFPERGPRDSRGRSLRDFDLKTRLFRYPVSYMIYSAAFEALPPTVKERVYRGLFDILTQKQDSDTIEILRQTKPDFAKLAELPPLGAVPAPASPK